MSRDPDDKGFEKSIGDHDTDRGEREVGRLEGEDEHGWAPDVGHGEAQEEAGDKAMEARDTHEGSKSEGGAIYAPQKGVEKVGESLTTGGEERGAKKKEPGREEEYDQEAGRPRAKTTPRFSTGVNPVDTVDEGMEDSPSGDQAG